MLLPQRFLSGIIGLGVGLWLACGPGGVAAAPPVDFETQIAPLFVQRCLECHNPRDAHGGLVLNAAERAARGGDSGPAWIPGQPSAGQLLARVSAGEMPPPRQGQPRPLPAAEQQLLRDWIEQGARWPADRTLDLFESTNAVRAGRDFWSLRPVQAQQVPPGQHDHPVDAFVAARLQVAGLQPAPPASRETLLRRVMYDLIGLPPTHEQVEQFVSDPDPLAYERAVDRLLSMPQFGERWARHWLDLVRFAETSGYERDQTKPFAWKYRDWVVRALNADLPYDRFVLEQLAGDELPDRNADSVIATGFLRLGTWNDEPNDPQEYKYERLEDLVHASSSAFLAISVKCARCHDHKFDPVTQEDYYRFAGAFWPGSIEPRDGKLLGGPSVEELGVVDVLGWTDVRLSPPPLHLFKKGDPKQPLAAVEPGPLSFLPRFDDAELPPAPANAPPTTRRRLRLARWLVDPANPLTRRVIVNRLWQHLFGQGLVRSPNDFGFNGAPPTHPELLDWLAEELLANGWRLKPLLRQLVLSRTYRQSVLAADPERGAEIDAANTLWWRAERRRRDAEGLRDALLAVTGELDLSLGGESFKPSIASEALEGLSRKSGAWQPSAPGDQRRRSLYIFSQRSLLPPLMTVFDFADTTLPCAQRDVTTVAPQALALLNNHFVHDRSRALARRVRDAAGVDPARQIELAWRYALGRAPQGGELQAAIAHLAAQRHQFTDEATSPTRATPAPADAIPRSGLVLELRADRGITTDADGRVSDWHDGSGAGHSATQSDPSARPQWVATGWKERPVVQFDGRGDFLKLAGQILPGQTCTVVAVASDEGSAGHREILSNWDGAAGNSTNSLFLGTTGMGQVRFSDDYSPGTRLVAPRQPFVLTAINSEAGVRVWQNGRELGSRGGALAPRNLSTAWVVGTQGNIAGEYWQGGLAELLVYDRSLTEEELRGVHSGLRERYGLVEADPPLSPEELALASLCHVLLNTNEFLYLD